jgi:signal transduction histidine kinase
LVVAVVLTGFISMFLVTSVFRDRLRSETGELKSRVQAGLREQQRRIELALSVVAGELLEEGGAFGRMAFDPAGRSRAEVTDAAGRLQRLLDLDVLQVIDGEGTVLSSGHWPQQAGIRETRFLEGIQNGVFLTLIPVAEGEIDALAVRRSYGEGERRLTIVVGMRVDEGLLLDISRGGYSVIREIGGRVVARSGSVGMEPWPGWEDNVAAGPFHREPDGSTWVLAAVSLRSFSGDVAGHVVAGLDRTVEATAVERLKLLLILAAAAAAVLALPVSRLLAGYATRPLEEMVRAVDAVSAGEADYTFPAAGKDEFRDLVVSFSRMRRALEMQRERLRAAERVAAWREAARRVAHEVKNPLAPIRLTMENLLKARERSPELFDEVFEEGARAVLEEVEQLRRIVTEFGEFARMPSPEPRPADLERIVDSVTALFAGEGRPQIRRIRDAELPALELDPDQISRALKNIVGNAVEALEGKEGLVTVRTGVEDGMALVEVSDTGQGLSEDALRRIFEPYFTTRTDGTGLGMAITFRIVTEHGGLLRTENRPEGGARVVMLLPGRGDEKP